MILAEVGWPEVGLAFVAALPALIAAFVGAMISWHNATQIKDAAAKTNTLQEKVDENTVLTNDIANRVEVVHLATNSMKDQLVAAAKLQGHSDGVRDEKDAQKALPIEENIVALEQNTAAVEQNTKDRA